MATPNKKNAPVNPVDSAAAIAAERQKLMDQLAALENKEKNVLKERANVITTLIGNVRTELGKIMNPEANKPIEFNELIALVKHAEKGTLDTPFSVEGRTYKRLTEEQDKQIKAFLATRKAQKELGLTQEVLSTFCEKNGFPLQAAYTRNDWLSTDEGKKAVEAEMARLKPAAPAAK